MTSEKIKLLQQAQLKIMCEVHQICVKNNLKYYLIGGTALGAVRHGGFIPWDIDIDIAMPRQDYDRFEEVCKTDLPDMYKYHNFKNTKNHIVPHAIVSMKNTSLTMKMNQVQKCGSNEIFIDIFPLDTPPEDPKLQQKQEKRLKFLKLIKERKRGVLFRNTSTEWFVKKLVSLALTPIPYSYIGKLQDKEMRRYHQCSGKYICSMASHYPYQRQLMPMEVYGNPTPMKFEGYDFFMPEKWDDYLTRIYNNYMQLPSQENRDYMQSYFQDVSINN